MDTLKMVVGFLFRRNLEEIEVALVTKNRPEWQRGLMNGPGGKVEPDENPFNAMRREFIEEAGVDIDSWKYFAKINCSAGEVYFFQSWVPESKYNDLKTVTDEKIGWYPISKISELPTIPNLKWMIPLSLDSIPQMTEIWYPIK